MSGKEDIIGRRFDTGEGVRVTLAGGVIAGTEPHVGAPENVWIAPALFDPQINGFAGVDFQSDTLTGEQLLTAVRGLRSAACGQFFFTLTTEEWPVMLERLKNARALRCGSNILQGAIAGWHIEGPFLSPEPGFHGAHDPACMRDATPELLRELRAAAGDDPLLITVAPERHGALDAIALAVAFRMRVSLGHTDASAKMLAAAVKAGATGFTHLGNGCPQALDRHDNIILRVLETEGLRASIIPDTIHVSPPMFRLLNSALSGGPAGTVRVCHTSDAMSAAGSPPGRYRIGRIVTEVGADRIVRMPGHTNFAGSALRPIDGVFKAARMTGESWRKTWKSSSLDARRYAGLTTKQDGLPFCVLTVEDDEFESGFIYVKGERTEIFRECLASG